MSNFKFRFLFSLFLCAIFVGTVWIDSADAKRGGSRSYSSSRSKSFSSSKRASKARATRSSRSYSKKATSKRSYGNSRNSSKSKYGSSRTSSSGSKYSSSRKVTPAKATASTASTQGKSKYGSSRTKSSSKAVTKKPVTAQGSKGNYSNRKSSTQRQKPKALTQNKKAQRVQQKYKSQKAQKSYAAYKKKSSGFKKKNPVKMSRTQTRKSPFYKKSSSYSRSNRSNRSYFDRRDSYYSGYQAPSYVMMGSPSYGALDGMFLGMMLSNAMHTPSYAQTYYHNQNSPGMQAWRSEMNELAKDNAELRGQLASLDNQVNGMQGTKRQPGYLPEGVDPDLVMSPDAAAQVLPQFNMCTALPTGNYHVFGNMMRSMAQNVEINLITTSGSLENLAKLDSGVCDGALAQADAYWLYAERNPATKLAFERIPDIYKEYGLFYCNRDSGVDDVDDLEEVAGKTLYVGAEGSGGEVMWANIVKEDDEFGVTTVKKMGGNAALMAMKSNKKSCGLYVSAGNSQFMKDLIKHSKWAKLVPATDGAFDEAEDPEGKRLYKFETIPSSTYGELQGGWLSSVETITVSADFLVSKAWIKRNGNTAYDGVIGTVLDVQPEFLAHVGQ